MNGIDVIKNSRVIEHIKTNIVFTLVSENNSDKPQPNRILFGAIV